MHPIELATPPTGADELGALTSWILDNLAWLVPSLLVAVGGAWAYAKFVVEKCVLPPSEFDIELRAIDVGKSDLVIEILANLKNLGSSTLVVQNLWIDILYLEKGDAVELWKDPSKKKNEKRCGRVDFSKKLRERLTSAAWNAARKKALGVWEERNKGNDRKPRGFPVAPYKTFVSPGVMQRYSFVTTLPAETSLVLVRAAFYYEPGGSALLRLVWAILQDFGLISHTLQHVREPHTCERVFRLPGARKGRVSSSGGPLALQSSR